MPESMLVEEIVLAQILIIAGASIVGALGWVHLLLIFFRGNSPTIAMGGLIPRVLSLVY